jgi:predicted ATP-grasp superfamily ATP-dependent carboligase
MKRDLRILLTEGSSLSARQTLTALGPLGYSIDVCDPQPGWCLARFSRYVRKLFRCPPFDLDPAGYLAFLVARLKSDRYDVLFPVHDQAYLLSRFRDDLAPLSGLAVPPFDVVRRMQSKAEFIRVLEELALPHPETVICTAPAEVSGDIRLPAYLKLAHSTAGCGVWHVSDRRELKSLLAQLPQESGELLIQQPGQGAFCVAQSVFQEGRLVAVHCYQARAQGVGGSAWARSGVSHPVVIGHLERLGRHLAWHGALMLDYFYDPDAGLAYVESNPRIGETVNAFKSGVNLCEALVRVSRGEEVERYPDARVGVRTHSLMMNLMALAQQTRSRPRLLAELKRAWSARDEYESSEEELTPFGDDRRSLIPAAYLAAKLLLAPASADRVIRQTVENYALSEAGVERIAKLSRDAIVQGSPGGVAAQQQAKEEARQRD